MKEYTFKVGPLYIIKVVASSLERAFELCETEYNRLDHVANHRESMKAFPAIQYK